MLLRTRFYIPPLRQGAVERPSLIERLQASSGGSLVVLAAPAGYGKTTLVSQWLHRHPQTFAWLTLGAEHNATITFWQYTIVALRQIQPDIGEVAEAMIRRQGEPDVRAVIVALLNDLDRLSIRNSARDPITLVMDDFHVLRNVRLLRHISLFLDHLPSCIRVVITSRDAPELGLARRRANGQLLEFGVAELRFDTAESAAFLCGTMELSLVPQQVKAFCERTEGWVAGLQLAAISHHRLPDDATGTELDRYVADYLLEEVFGGLDQDVQRFLLQTASVKRFCAGLCNAMTGQNDALNQLAMLEREHLFLVPLDNHRTWYRYHDLFRQFLRARSRHDAVIDTSDGYWRALRWLESQGHYEDALALCLNVHLWDEACRMLAQALLVDPLSMPQETLQRWVQPIPAEYLACWPDILRHVRSDNGDEDRVVDAAADALMLMEPLTQQEQAVLSLIAQGLPNKVIAERLHISLNTLKVHIRNLYGKMGVENRTQALLKIKH